MYKTVRYTVSSVILLLLLPLIVWFSQWKWEFKDSAFLIRFFYFITETVNTPCSILISILLSIYIVRCLQLCFKSAFLLIIIMNSIIITGQLTKHFIKEQIKEPRPYMIWLSKIHNFDKRIFHHLRRDEVTNIVSIMLSQDTQIPRWLKNYWIQESSFSFPSGHSIFVTTWSLLATILLWPRRYIKTVVFLFLWADAVMASRLFLGMHWSWDLIFAILLSWLLIIAFTCIKIVSSFFLIKNYEQDF